jgi:hypothetical protein
MRRSTACWLPLLVTPFLVLTVERTGQAGPIDYTTSGDIGTASGVPIGSFDFNSTSGTMLPPGVFSLGSFAARALPDGAGLTYHNLPFYIDVTLRPQGPPGSGTSVMPSGLSISGMLNGTVTGTTSSDVVATVTSVTQAGSAPLPFSLSSFNVLGPQTLAPSGINGGITSLMGQVNGASPPPPIPEPTPLALMGILAVGAGLRAGIRRFKQRI